MQAENLGWDLFWECLTGPCSLILLPPNLSNSLELTLSCELGWSHCGRSFPGDMCQYHDYHYWHRCSPGRLRDNPYIPRSWLDVLHQVGPPRVLKSHTSLHPGVPHPLLCCPGAEQEGLPCLRVQVSCFMVDFQFIHSIPLLETKHQNNYCLISSERSTKGDMVWPFLCMYL